MTDPERSRRNLERLRQVVNERGLVERGINDGTMTMDLRAEPPDLASRGEATHSCSKWTALAFRHYYAGHD